jgi:diaminopimelate epimerase
MDTGAPHCVIFMDENPGLFGTPFEEAEIAALGRVIRYHERFSPVGTNVNFVHVDGEHRLVVRTYERGVEEETLACGTGSVASSIVAHLFQKAESPVTVRARSGELLHIAFTDRGNGNIGDVTLEGGAAIVYEGTIIYDTDSDGITY